MKIGIVSTSCFLLFSLVAQSAPPSNLVTSSIDDRRLIAVPGSVHRLARPEFDRGRAANDFRLDRMLLVLQRSPEAQVALDKFLLQVQDPTSASYHKWLTPEQFGQQFGASDSDIRAITAWLGAHGFQVNGASAGRTVIEFSGNAGQVENAFHTQIHRFSVNGKDHWANSTDPMIPSALSPAVVGIHSLHDFFAAPQSSSATLLPQFTSSSGTHYLSPADYAAIYNINPLYPAITGAGITIAVVGRTNINVQDVTSFRSLMGLSAKAPNIILNGTNPGDLGGGEEAEAVLDVTWAGALAKDATVDLVVSKSTNTTDGVSLSEMYIVNHNLAPVMTESFGLCEAYFSAAQLSSQSSLAQQAAAQGITWLVSTGDSGSAGCDDPNSANTATHGLSVNALASTPYTVAVGGTQFNEGGTPSTYWNSTNAADRSSARSHIPEEVWNENCTGSSCTATDIWAGGGGASSYFAKPSWQSGVTGIPNDGVRDIPDVSLTAAAHDGYLLCLQNSCNSSSGSFWVINGTSASTPSFAGVVALINQKTGSRQGQITLRLYALAAAQGVGSCNGSNAAAPPAANCVFYDVTVGTNAVPGEAGFNTSSQNYPATTGYDLATGLGSVNVANLVNGWVASPAAVLNPTGLTFASQTVGTTSSSQSIVLSNAGNATLSIASIAASGGNAADFVITTSCGSSVAAGQTCPINVVFKPAAAGTRTSTLVVTDNAGNVVGSTQTASLAGTGATVNPASGASATYAGADSTTRGTWTGKYGADGQIIPNAVSNIPSYAAVSVTSALTYTWTTSTSDPRALQTAANSTSRIASTYYTYTSLAADVNFTDGNAHKISLYLCDWDFGSRAETISILDASNNAVLDSRSFSNFVGGVYSSWTLRGHVRIQVQYNSGNNALVNAIFFDTAATGGTTSSSASFLAADSTTRGTWTGHFGADGQLIPGDLLNSPSYAQVAFTGASTYTWTNSTSDTRALQASSGSTARIASTYYSFGTFTVDLNLTDGNAHNISVYLCDWDAGDRTETISILDASTSAVLDSRAISAFTAGVYESWTVRGHVRIQVTYNGGNNALLNAMFFN